MKKYSSVIWGLVLVTAGIILGGNALGWFDINIFFPGWWTLFIIVPCFVSFITEPGERIGHLIGVLIGVFLLLASLDVISFETLWKMIFPIIIILIGLVLIFKNLFSHKFDEATAKLSEKIKKEDESGTTFGGLDVNMNGEEFKGKKISAVFGAY